LKFLALSSVFLQSLTSYPVAAPAPLHEETRNFMEYRCMMIESSLYSIEQIVMSLERHQETIDDVADEIRYHLMLIKFNLGNND